MKKIIALCMTAVIMLSFAACSNNNTSGPPKGEDKDKHKFQMDIAIEAVGEEDALYYYDKYQSYLNVDSIPAVSEVDLSFDYIETPFIDAWYDTEEKEYKQIYECNDQENTYYFYNPNGTMMFTLPYDEEHSKMDSLSQENCENFFNEFVPKGMPPYNQELEIDKEDKLLTLTLEEEQQKGEVTYKEFYGIFDRPDKADIHGYFCLVDNYPFVISGFSYETDKEVRKEQQKFLDELLEYVINNMKICRF